MEPVRRARVNCSIRLLGRTLFLPGTVVGVRMHPDVSQTVQFEIEGPDLPILAAEGETPPTILVEVVERRAFWTDRDGAEHPVDRGSKD